MSGPPNMQLPPVTSSEVSENTSNVGRALQKKATREADPANYAPRTPPRAAPSVYEEDIVAKYRTAPKPAAPKAPVAKSLPEGEMTLADLAAHTGVRLPSIQSEPDGEGLDEAAGWSAGQFLQKRTPQVRRTGAGLAGAAIKKMKIE